MDLQSLGKFLLLLAVGLALAGVLMIVGGRLGLGSLPGDIRVQRGTMGCFIPIMSSLVLSIILTIILNLLLRWFR